MNRLVKLGFATVLAAGVTAAFMSPIAIADTHHDSNTLHKMGNAIQYPIRKAGENTSIDAHRAEGRKSVQHTNHGHNVVITPQGNKFPMHSRYAHRHPRHYGWTRGHHRGWSHSHHQH